MGPEATRTERDVVGFVFADGTEMEIWRPKDEFRSFFGAGPGPTRGGGRLGPLPGPGRQRLRDHRSPLKRPGVTSFPQGACYSSPPGPRSPGLVSSLPSPSGRFSLRLVACPEITANIMIPRITNGTSSIRDTMAMLT